MKKIAILVVVASLALATLACSALTPATAVPIFIPAATEVLPPTASPEPSPTPTPLKVQVLGVEVYSSWEDADQKYPTLEGYVWLAVQLEVMSGDPDAAIEGWIREDEFPVILGDGIELSDGTLVYVLEDGGALVLVFPIPGDASTEGLTLHFPDGSEYPLEAFFQGGEPQRGPQA